MTMPTSNPESSPMDRISIMGPPFEQCMDPNPIELSDLTRNNLSPGYLGIGGEVVVWWESDLVVAAELNGEATGGLVYGVAMD